MNGWVSFWSRPSLSLVSPGRAIHIIFTRMKFVECKHSCRWSSKKQVRIHEISRSPSSFLPAAPKKRGYGRTDGPTHPFIESWLTTKIVSYGVLWGIRVSGIRKGPSSISSYSQNWRRGDSLHPIVDNDLWILSRWFGFNEATEMHKRIISSGNGRRVIAPSISAGDRVFWTASSVDRDSKLKWSSKTNQNSLALIRPVKLPQL